MPSYKYRIVHKEKWFFELLPSNSNRIYVARSCEYATCEEAYAGIQKLKTYLAAHPAPEIQEQMIVENGIKLYRGEIFFAPKEYLYTRNYNTTRNRAKCIRNIMAQYHVSVRTDLNMVQALKTASIWQISQQTLTS